MRDGNTGAGEKNYEEGDRVEWMSTLTDEGNHFPEPIETGHGSQRSDS